MKARITIDVIGDSGRNFREQRIVEINRRVIRVYEAVENDRVERMVAQDMMSHAMRAVDPAARAQQQLNSMPGAGPTTAPVRKNTGVAAALGLDLIQEAVEKEGPDRQVGPGPIGFGRPGERR